jgi:hypothetical protein
MGKKMDVYFPLIVGDWLKGTRGMKAEVKGVYIGLLLYQWDNGHIPASLDELSLIEPEVGKVWVSISSKFIEVEPGKLQNQKVEEVRNFFQKQRQNGLKGGRNPKGIPNNNPKGIPKGNLHNIELGIELGIDNEFKEVGGVGEGDDRILHIGQPNGHRISVKAKYIHDRPMIVHDLGEFFRVQNQLEDIQRAGWIDFDGFMRENPGAVFDDPKHVYNAFRKFSTTKNKPKYDTNRNPPSAQTFEARRNYAGKL